MTTTLGVNDLSNIDFVTKDKKVESFKNKSLPNTKNIQVK